MNSKTLDKFSGFKLYDNGTYDSKKALYFQSILGNLKYILSSDQMINIVIYMTQWILVLL